MGWRICFPTPLDHTYPIDIMKLTLLLLMSMPVGMKCGPFRTSRSGGCSSDICLANAITSPELSFGNLREMTISYNTTVLDICRCNISSIAPGGFRELVSLKWLVLSFSRLSVIEPEMFENLTKLDRLSVRKNVISSIAPGSFRELVSLKWLDLSFNRLSIITPGMFENLTKLECLYLTVNKILSIEPGSFDDLVNMQHMDLPRNQIARLPRNLFYNLNNIIYLSFSYNNLVNFIVRFQNGSNLEEINLSENKRLTSIGKDDFNGLWHLKRLNFSKCSITALNKRLFHDLLNIEVIDLSCNRFRIFDVRFQNGTKLKELYLMRNKELSYIGDESLKGLTYLKILDLSYCELTDIPYKLFYDSPNIEFIDLHKNSLKTFDVRFHNETTLKELLLSNNTELTYIGPDSLKGLWKHTELDLSGYGITKLPKEIFYELTSLVKLDLSFNKFQRFDVKFKYGTMLEILTLSGNKKLTSMGHETLNGLVYLKRLDVSSCGLTDIPNKLFYDLRSLKFLNLRGNNLERFDVAFQEGAALEELNLVMVSLKNMKPESFENLHNLIIIRTSEFWLCCAQNVGEKNQKKCKNEKFTLSSCDDLIRYDGLRIFVWIMGFAATLGNLAVIVYRLLLETERNTTYKIFIGHLSVSDLMMGIYLIIIASVDERYRNAYGSYKLEWMDSLLCMICGFLSTMSSETSAIFIFLITLDRFLVNKFPLKGIRFNRISTRVSCALAWLIGFVLALIPFLPVPPFQGWEMYSSNDMCVGLPLSVSRPTGWGYSVAIFVGLNFLLFLLIAFGQIAICWTFVRNRPNVTSPTFQRRRRQQEIAVARSLSLIVVSDFLCWFPIGVLGFLTAFGIHVGTEGYIWTAAVVLPINSALNPLLYTLGSVKDKLAAWKEARTKRNELWLSRRNKFRNKKGDSTTGKGTSSNLTKVDTPL